MAKCIDCGKPVKMSESYIYLDEHKNEWPIHPKCAIDHFICPDCGKVYPDSTYDYNGFCEECDSKHNED